MSKLIAIDNGHGQNTAGKRTPVFIDGTKSPVTGRNYMAEWEYNRATAIYLKIELERCGFRVVECSPTDIDTTIGARARVAVSAKADLLLSIHANAHTGAWGTANGTETLVCGTESTRIGKIVQKHLISELGLRDRGIKDGCWLGLSTSATNIPVVLVESAFMDNPAEAKLLLSEKFRKLSAIAIAKGICEAYGIKYISEENLKEEVIKTMSKYFDDVKEQWKADYIDALHEKGIVNGKGNGKFDPDSPITRAETCVVVKNAIDYVMKELKK